MKKTLLLFIILLATTLTYGQAASKVNNGQNINTSVANPTNLLGCEPLPTGTFKPYIKDDLRWETYNINNLSTYIGTVGSGLFRPISYVPTSGEISTSLGYTPYNGTANPAGFLTSYTETDPLFNTKFSLKTTTDLAEGSGLYWTTGRFNTAFATKSTNDLIEGSNLYYTLSRFNSAFGAKTTSDLAEGVNLYYTAGRFNTSFAGKTTTDLAEGANLYYSDTRARNSVSLTTTGTTGASTYSNLTGVLNIPNYAPTNAQVISALGFTPYNSTNPNGYITASSTNTLTNKSGNISQWTNDSAYVNQAGARTAISLTTNGVSGSSTYNSSTGVLNVPNYANSDYTNTVVVAGGAGNAVFYLTSDKTSTGTALYTNVTYVSPIVNDSTVNYTYGWSYNAGTKALTVNVKQATGINVALLSLTLLGLPANVPNGTNVQILVKGN